MSSGRLMNVCQHLPGVKISCSQVSADGYDATNLISKDFQQKRMGFMAESFIKPPVEIDLTLPCSTHLSHIVIGTSVGNQKSNGFELTTGSNIFLGRTPYQNQFKTDKICFVNRSFRTRQYFNQNDIVLPSNSTRLDLRTPGGMQRLRVQNLRIRILSTQGSSIPCLGALEVWGLPNIITTETIDPNNAEKHIKVEDTNQEQEVLCIEDNDTNVTVSNPIPSGSGPLDIPEEFMDSLTYEMMSLPVLLPSGNTIDQTSIDRHLKAEALWGRCPSDPFTGIPFGPGYAPLPNVPLKSRIDRFLLVHGTNLQVPRTVGGKNTSQRNVSRLLGETVCGKRKDDSERSEVYNVAKKKFTPALQTVPRLQNGGEKAESHEDELKHSLESALTMTLRDLKSYTEPQQAHVDVVQCCQCLKVTGNLYRLRCSHVLCGPCIQVKLSSVKTLCSQCQLPFTSADPCKIHVT